MSSSHWTKAEKEIPVKAVVELQSQCVKIQSLKCFEWDAIYPLDRRMLEVQRRGVDTRGTFRHLGFGGYQYRGVIFGREKKFNKLFSFQLNTH